MVVVTSLSVLTLHAPRASADSNGCTGDEIDTAGYCIDYDYTGNGTLYLSLTNGAVDWFFPNDHGQWCTTQINNILFSGYYLAGIELYTGYCDTTGPQYTRANVGANAPPNDGNPVYVNTFNQWGWSYVPEAPFQGGIAQACIQNPVGQGTHYVCYQEAFGPDY